MQDEIQDDQPQIDTNPRLRAALYAVAALAVAVAIGLFLADRAFDQESSPFGELSEGVQADVAINLNESFAVDADGSPTPELDALLAELEADSSVAAFEYLGPVIIRGAAPGAPGIEVEGHEILVALNNSFLPGAKNRFADKYVDHPGVGGIAVAS